jgi:crotonobetainyl-CoA:carnitine CoA-transferase CaiB-like acyl-CoA transferase
VAALEDVVVVECSQRLAGPFASLRLRLLGADVVKVEPPGGDVARSWGSGAVFSTLNAGKRLITLDGNDGEVDGARLANLLDGADIAVVDSGPAVQIARAVAGNGRLASVVVIEQDLVPGGYGATETTAQAALALAGYVGDPSGSPARVGADLASATAGVLAAQAALAGLVATRRPIFASVSLARALATMKTIHLAARSDPAGWEGYHVTAGDRTPDQGYRTADGLMSFEFPPNLADGWRSFCRWLGLDDLIEELGDEWYPTVAMGERAAWARPRYEAVLASVTRDAAVAAARERGGWAMPFLGIPEVLAHPQVQRYGAVHVDDQGRASLASPWKFAGVDDEWVPLVPAPAAGAHNTSFGADGTHARV